MVKKAKQFGVVTGETIYQAKQKCPALQVFEGKHDKLFNESKNRKYSSSNKNKSKSWEKGSAKK